jgi:hypothetical protein
MGKYTDQLIEIYARCDTDKVSEDPAYRQLCSENAGQALFNSEREKVEKIKQMLEKSVAKQSSFKNQVIEALISLNRTIIKPKNEEEIDICYTLIIRGYSKDWNQNQLDHFNKYYAALQHNYDYFLSFTDRNPDPECYNEINIRHQFLIKRILGSDNFKKANKKENLLARAIHSLLLRDGNKRGFFYPQKEGDNQKVEEKLRRACEHCFVFIQIIQNIMFACDNKTNYCYFEYCHAHKCLAGKKGPIFLLAEKSHDSLIKRRDVHPDYDEWYQETLDRDKIILETTENYNPTHISKLLDTIRKNLVEKIDKIKWEIIEDVPD